MKPEDYAQGDAFQVEKRTIFSTEWLPICAEGQIARPGDFLSVTIGGWGVVAVRDGAGTVRVLRNTCRHQNMPVVGTPSGTCETFRCRFHGWTYDLAGKLVSAPPPVAPADPDSPTVNLIAFEARCDAGLVSFTFDPAKAPVQVGGPLPAYGGTIAAEIACNWKVCVEHLLGEQKDSSPAFTFHWPLLTVRRAGPMAIVEQVVPHTFLRTRLLTHVFGQAAEGHKPAAALIKQACEGLQADRVAGMMTAADGTLLADFHHRLETAYAQARAVI